MNVKCIEAKEPDIKAGDLDVGDKNISKVTS